MNENQAVVSTKEKPMEFVPFGATDKIKLSIDIVKRLIAVPTKTGRTCSDRDAIKFMMLCQAKGLNPFEGDAYLIGYDSRQADGSILPIYSQITSHQAFLKRAELHPEYDGMKSGVIVKGEAGAVLELEGDFYLDGQEVIGGWATVFFKNRKTPMTKRVRLARFNKGLGIWKDDPAGMICKCAEADALRSAFPTKIGGLYLREEGAMPQVTTGDAHEIAASRIEEAVPVREIEAGSPPADQDQQPIAAPKQTQSGTSRQELEQLCASEGYTFNHLQRWSVETGNIPNADSLSGFAEIAEADAKRLLRAKVGLLKGLAQLKAMEGGDK